MLQNAKLVSNIVRFGPSPTLGTPVEQRLTISASGRIWFTEYVAGIHPSAQPLIGREIQTNVGSEKAQSILSLLEQYRDSNPPERFVTDVGVWKLIMTDTNGQRSILSGSLYGDVTIHDVKLTNILRQAIPIDDLVAFE